MLSLTTYRRPAASLNSWIDSFLDTEFAGWPERTTERWAPRVDVVEEKDHYLLHADVPGMKRDDIKVSVENGVLSISGERNAEKREKKEGNYEYFERSYGSFNRSFNLPEHVDTSKIKASYRDGVLELEIPKTEKALPKQIEVKVN